MKKAILLLLLSALAVLTACAKGRPAEADLFRTVCPADEGLRMAKASGAAAVIENSRCTAGGEVWDAFWETVGRGTPASVLCARYHTLDPAHMSEELYEAEKDLYPQLYFYLLEYDGEGYVVKIRLSTEKEPEEERAFRHLLHFTGKAPPTAAFSEYDYYVLADDPDVTWEEILAGMVSSQASSWIPHCTVYQNLLD